MESCPGDRYSGAARGGPGLQCITSVLMGAAHHLKMSHCPPVRSRLTQVRFLPAVVRFRLHDKPGLGPLRQWGQEDTTSVVLFCRAIISFRKSEKSFMIFD